MKLWKTRLSRLRPHWNPRRNPRRRNSRRRNSRRRMNRRRSLLLPTHNENGFGSPSRIEQPVFEAGQRHLQLAELK